MKHTCPTVLMTASSRAGPIPFHFKWFFIVCTLLEMDKFYLYYDYYYTNHVDRLQMQMTSMKSK